MNEPATTFAWCFSHGRLHHFNGEPWCTATWAVLPGSTEEQAMVAKEERYGNAEFLHQLPDDQHLALIDAHRSTAEAAASVADLDKVLDVEAGLADILNRDTEK